MPPAHECFDAEQALGAEVNYRLIFEKEFLLSERTTDIRLQAQSFVQHVLHLRLESDVAVLAGCLGVVHGNVCVAEQRLGAAFGRGKGNADARRDAYLYAIECER